MKTSLVLLCAVIALAVSGPWEEIAFGGIVRCNRAPVAAHVELWQSNRVNNFDVLARDHMLASGYFGDGNYHLKGDIPNMEMYVSDGISIYLRFQIKCDKDTVAHGCSPSIMLTNMGTYGALKSKAAKDYIIYEPGTSVKQEVEMCL